MSHDTKDRLLASLLQPKGKPISRQLIEEVLDDTSSIANNGKSIEVFSPPVTPVAEDGPTLMELMMEAQREALREKTKESEVLAVKETKSFGGGFKKGFFGGSGGSSSNSSKSKQSATDSSNSTSTGNAINHIPTITKKVSNNISNKVSNRIVEEVQEALKEEENPMLAKLKSGDWVTPDLVQQFQSNPIVARGLNNPRCQAAIQAMQENPTNAKKKFGNDPEVDLFMREFGKVMAAHFETLGSASPSPPPSPSPSPSSATANSSSSIGNSRHSSSVAVVSSTSTSASGNMGGVTPVIQEIGPLQAQAIKKSKEPNAFKQEDAEVDDSRVQEILQNEELRAMLMDPEMQRVLQECNNPARFQFYMRDPKWAIKIKKLFDSGLVGVAK